MPRRHRCPAVIAGLILRLLKDLDIGVDHRHPPRRRSEVAARALGSGEVGEPVDGFLRLALADDVGRWAVLVGSAPARPGARLGSSVPGATSTLRRATRASAPRGLWQTRAVREMTRSS